MSLFNVFNIAGSALAAQSRRLNTVASNLANAQSVAEPGGQPFKARHVVFQAAQVGSAPESVGVEVTAIVEDSSPAQRAYDPGNPRADGDGYVTTSNVNVADEMVDMISAARAYQTNVEVMNTAKQLMLKALTLGSGGQ